MVEAARHQDQERLEQATLGIKANRRAPKSLSR